jgi:S1-C subfamily serine protease
VVSPNGVVVTNLHVIRESIQLQVAFQDLGHFADPVVLAYDADNDVAILGPNLGAEVKCTFVPTGDADQINPGARVYVIGNPLGLENSITGGSSVGVGARADSRSYRSAPPSHPRAAEARFLTAKGKWSESRCRNWRTVRA